jgi:aldehyde dehydrogenase (NAD+)
MGEPLRVANLIGGERRETAQTFERHDPADHRRLVTVAPDSSARDVEEAVSAAAGETGWAGMAVTGRAEILEKAASILEGRQQEIGAMMTAEMGKPRSAAENEVVRTAENLRLYAGEALRLGGNTFPADSSALVLTTLDPVGVVGVITPWNFPLTLSSRKIGPALAAGNTVVFKPSSMTPGTTEALGTALLEAGVPGGAIQVIHGFGAGAALVADPRVAAVTFTGSTAVGRKIHEAMGLGRRVQLELGGNNPVVVLADADLDQAASVVLRSSFSLSGQACTAAGRILADEAIHDDLLERTVKLAEQLVVGPGNADGVEMGPLIDEGAVAAMQAAVDDAVSAGAAIATGGRRLEGEPFDYGWFYPPTILEGVDPEMTVSCTEVFGPVIGFERVSGLDEAIARANDTEYGLTSAVCTRDLGSAHRFAREVKAGIVRVNRPTVGTPVNAPFGGIKMSGSGTHKEQLGPTVMDFYTQARTLFIGT